MKIGVIDVGGGLRGIYAVGVFDYCMDHDIRFDLGIGVSAGSANLASYAAGQRGRNHQFYTEYAFRKQYMSMRNFILKHSFIDLDYVYGTLSQSDGENPLDYCALRDNPMEFHVVATNAQTGQAKYFDKNFLHDQSNEKIWEAIYNVPDEEVWKTRVALKNKLIDYIRNQFRDTWLKNQRDPSRVVSLMDKINPNALLIGFARRFATYKRAHLLFTDLDRLAKIVNNPDYPVQFLFAGKAHPHDGAGQGLIKKIVEISNRPEFLGKIIFLENYDMKLARRLVSGVDIWMNTPTRPLEASGTSGEKALMNGVVNLSVLDGWWLEGYREGAGWALTEKRTYQNQEHQDQLDAATIYSLLETEILPLYYARNKKGYSEGWVKTIKNSIAQVAPHYTMKRQLDDYFTKFYGKEAARFHELAANDYAKAKEIAKWKEEVAEKWDSIEVVSMDKCEDLRKGNIETGKEYVITCVVDEKGLDDAVGIELVTTYTTAEGKEYVYSVEPMEMVHRDGNLFTFKVTHSLSNSGSFKVAYRMFPKHEALPHRQDFCYVRWFNKD